MVPGNFFAQSYIQQETPTYLGVKSIYLITANLNMHVFADTTLLSDANMRNAVVDWPKKLLINQ